MHWIIKTMVWLLVSLAILVAGVIAVNSNIKASVDPENVSHTSHFQDGKFHNEYQFEQPGLVKFLQIIKRYITEPATDKQPVQALPLQQVTREMLDALPDNDVHFVKLGHSSVLLKVLGEYWLLDPVFAERASPFLFWGPNVFIRHLSR